MNGIQLPSCSVCALATACWRATLPTALALSFAGQPSTLPVLHSNACFHVAAVLPILPPYAGTASRFCIALCSFATGFPNSIKCPGPFPMQAQPGALPFVRAKLICNWVCLKNITALALSLCRHSPAPFLFCVQLMVPCVPPISLVATW